MHVTGQYMSPTSMKFDAYRMHHGEKVSESTMNVDLENGHLLKSHIHWRPEMIKDFKVYSRHRIFKERQIPVSRVRIATK